MKTILLIIGGYVLFCGFIVLIDSAAEKPSRWNPFYWLLIAFGWFCVLLMRWGIIPKDYFDHE